MDTDPERRYRIPDIRRHKWFNMQPISERDSLASKGLIVGVNTIPINRKIIMQLEEKYNIKRQYARKCLMSNKHNHVTTTYYLLYQKYQRMGMLNAEDELDLLSDDESTKNLFGNL